MKHDIRNRNTQRGAVLAIGLILLAVATLVTLTAMNTGVMQERMTANQDNNARSFMAAEAGGAELVSWINTEIAAHGQITGPHPASVTPEEVGGDSSITYVMNLYSASWTSFPLKVLIEGRALAADDATVLARTELLVEWREPPRRGPNPPAAISCFNGPCTIKAGAGRGADEGYGTVSGFNHPIPSLDCTGAGCRMQPTGPDRLTPAVPAVYLEQSGSVGLQGGNHDAYQGLGPDGSAVKGKDESVAASPGDAIYPNDADGNSTAPTWQSVFGENEPETLLESGNTSLSGMSGNATEVGILVVNGEDLVVTGTSLFVGLIVIRDCGTLQMKGNPNVYGAIIVDATSCGPNYDPFGGSGTPAVRFVGGPGGGGSGVGTDGSGITIWSERLL
jgi:hypothetical protein